MDGEILEKSKETEGEKPPEAPVPAPETVEVEPQKEVNPLEARLEALEKRWQERDEREKKQAEESKEVKHGEVQETKASDSGDVKKSVLQTAKGNEGGGGPAGGDKSGGVAESKPESKPGPGKRIHHFKFRAKRAKPG